MPPFLPQLASSVFTLLPCSAPACTINKISTDLCFVDPACIIFADSRNPSGEVVLVPVDVLSLNVAAGRGRPSIVDVSGVNTNALGESEFRVRSPMTKNLPPFLVPHSFFSLSFPLVST